MPDSPHALPILVGIAGGSGSGKTHLARQLLAAVPEHVSMLCMDQYFRTEVPGDPSNINFDHPAHLDLELMLEHLAQLKEGKAVLAPSYDFHSRQQTLDAIEIKPCPVILVDGLFVLAEPFAGVMDMTIFLDVADDQRLLGRILRDAQERGATIPQIVDRYQRFVRPSYAVFVEPTKQNADIVVDFTYRRSFLSVLLAHIVDDYVHGRLDLREVTIQARSDNYRLGYQAHSPVMPRSVDIRELAKAYPETEVPSGVPQSPAAHPRLFLPNGSAPGSS